MNTSRPLYTPGNVCLTWDDNPEGDNRTYARDGSIIRRHYSALMHDKFAGFGHMSVLLHKKHRFAEVEDFEVAKYARNRGIGGMILRAAVKHLKSQEFNQLYSEEVSSDALYVRRSVLGEDMRFYQHDNKSHTYLADVTFDDALRQAYGAERDRRLRKPRAELRSSYDIVLDLTTIDDTDWELPIPFSEYSALFAEQQSSSGSL